MKESFQVSLVPLSNLLLKCEACGVFYIFASVVKDPFTDQKITNFTNQETKWDINFILLLKRKQGAALQTVLGTPFPAIYMGWEHTVFPAPTTWISGEWHYHREKCSARALFYNWFRCWGFLLSQMVASGRGTWAERARQQVKEAAA